LVFLVLGVFLVGGWVGGALPFPNEETTPPVVNTNLVMWGPVAKEVDAS
jgi:hypothetical protein